jgi:hypothetical protein
MDGTASMVGVNEKYVRIVSLKSRIPLGRSRRETIKLSHKPPFIFPKYGKCAKNGSSRKGGY